MKKTISQATLCSTMEYERRKFVLLIEWSIVHDWLIDLTRNGTPPISMQFMWHETDAIRFVWKNTRDYDFVSCKLCIN
jgi:hypothetical protein